MQAVTNIVDDKADRRSYVSRRGFILMKLFASQDHTRYIRSVAALLLVLLQQNLRTAIAMEYDWVLML